METKEERAKKYIQKNFHRIVEEMPIEKGMETLYIESAEEERKIYIDWLKENADRYFVTSQQADCCFFDTDSMIDDLRKL